MNTQFACLMNASIYGALFIAAIIIIRLIFKRIPAGVRCILWILAGIRLLVPFSLMTPVGVMPADGFLSLTASVPGRGATVILPDYIQYSLIPEYADYEQMSDSADDSLETDDSAGRSAEAAEATVAAPIRPILRHLDSLPNILLIVYISGVLIMTIYAAYGYLKTRRMVRFAVPRDYVCDGQSIRIYVCDRTDTAFVFGVIRPKIYVPHMMNDAQLLYVARHELTHIRRFDHIAKPCMFILLILHWFNPFVWAAFYLYGVDIEEACDERVIRDYGVEERQIYAQALLAVSASGRLSPVPQVMFGEVQVRGRIRHVVDYIRPRGEIYFICAAMCAVLILIFFTGRGVPDVSVRWRSAPSDDMGYEPDESGYAEYHTEHYDLYPNDYDWGYEIYKDGASIGFFSYNDPIVIRDDSGDLWMYNYYDWHSAYIPTLVDDELQSAVIGAVEEPYFWYERDMDDYRVETDPVTGLSYMYPASERSWSGKVVLYNERDAEIFNSLAADYCRRYSYLISDIDTGRSLAEQEIMGRCFRSDDGFTLAQNTGLQCVNLKDPDAGWSVYLTLEEFERLDDWLILHREGFARPLDFDTWRPILDGLDISYFNGYIDTDSPRYAVAYEKLLLNYGGTYPPDGMDEYHASMQLFNHMKMYDEDGDFVPPGGVAGMYVDEDINISEYHHYTEVPEAYRKEMYELCLEEFIKWNGIGRGDTRRSEVYRDYQLNVPKEERLSGTWTLQQYETAYKRAMAEAVRNAIPDWDYGEEFDTDILTGLSREEIERGIVFE